VSEPDASRRPVALVTGASRGIGRAIAGRLAAGGYDLTVSARTAGTIEAAAADLREHGGQVEAVVADMADDEQTGALADRHVARFGTLDVLVLAAGVGMAGPLDDFPVRRLDRQLAVNLRAPFLLVQRLLPALRAAAAAAPGGPGSKIIAIASITGMAAEPGLAAYGASKAALISLCESVIAAEAGHGVSATAISPGFVDTDMARWQHDQIDPATMISAADIAELAWCVTRLSRYAAVPNIPVTRPGPLLWRA
jgi:NAD(P)-dependent dehydrogenase (short-subunit alcohol dehydrogenase family)